MLKKILSAIPCGKGHDFVREAHGVYKVCRRCGKIQVSMWDHTR